MGKKRMGGNVSSPAENSAAEEMRTARRTLLSEQLKLYVHLRNVALICAVVSSY